MVKFRRPRADQDDATSLLGPPATAKASASKTTSSTSQPEAKPKAKKRRLRASAKLYSIDRDRSIEFNLQLDINNLRQEIRTLTARKEITSSRALLTRQIGSGSALRLVREYYKLYGWYTAEIPITKQSLSRPRYSELKPFLESIASPNVDCGDGVIGIDAMWNQVACYAETCMTPMMVKMLSFELIQVDADVTVRTRGFSHILITRRTLEMVYPHVLAEETLVARLVNKVLKTAYTLDMRFDECGKLTHYHLSLDLVQSFMQVLKDAVAVATVLDKALMGVNHCLLLSADDLQERKPTLHEVREEFTCGYIQL